MNQDVPLQQELQPLLLALKFLQVQLVLSKRYSGGYSVGDHLFPFRTEKLSPTAPMVLHTRGRVGRRQLYFQASFSVTTERGFFVSAHICAFAHLHICIFAHSPALYHLHFPKHKAQAQNATSNWGDASRVGKRCSYYLVDLSLARRETRRPH